MEADLDLFGAGAGGILGALVSSSYWGAHSCVYFLSPSFFPYSAVFRLELSALNLWNLTPWKWTFLPLISIFPIGFLLCFSDVNISGSYCWATAGNTLVLSLIKSSRQTSLYRHTGVCVCEKRDMDLSVHSWPSEEVNLSHKYLQISLSSAVFKIEVWLQFQTEFNSLNICLTCINLSAKP